MRRWAVVLLLCGLVGLVSGCAADRGAVYGDDAKIAKAADSHYAEMSAYSVDGRELSMTARGFEGVKTVWQYEAESDGEATLDSSLLVSGGKAKLVLVTPANEVVVLAENGDGAAEARAVPLKKGSNRIRIVGADGAGFTLVLGASVGELVSK